MPTAETANNRRSSRVFIKIRVHARGKNLEGRSFRQSTETIVVNAHGGLMYLDENLEMGADLVIANPATEEEIECRVVYLGDAAQKGRRVGVEFLSPAPHFWGVEFPPPDWPPKESSTAN